MKAKLVAFFLLITTHYCQSQCTWTGAVSNNWFDAGNWSCGTIPTNLDDVIVSSGSPVITAGNIATCRNLSKSGFVSSINLNSATLQIFGNLNYTAGSFVTNSTSSIQFKGTIQQLALGGTPLNVSNIVIDNPSGLVMNKNITASGTINLQAGHIFTNNFLLTAAAISGASTLKYIVTGDINNNPATSGGFKITIPPGGAEVIHVGPKIASYNPCVIQNTAGPAESFTVRVNLSALPGPSTTQCVQRTWQIDENTIGGNTANLVLLWDEIDEGTSFTRSLCGIYKSNGVSIDYTGYTPQNGMATFVGGTTWQKQLNGITTFSPWGVTSSPSILPMSLSAFNLSTINNKKVQLNWSVAQGSSVQYFEVLKNNNPRHFDFVKRVDATQNLNYQFVDEQPLPGDNFYVLKMVDANGQSKYSHVLQANIYQKGYVAATVFPNPVNNVLYLKLNAMDNDNAVIYLINNEGKQILVSSYTLNKGNNSIDINVEKLAAGTYQLLISTSNGSKLSNTIIKQ